MQSTEDFLLDHEGSTWSASSPRLRDLYETPECGSDFPDYVVRGLSFARLRYSRSSVRVGFCRASLSADTVSAVVDAMLEAECNRYVLEDVSLAAPPLILTDVEDAAACFLHMAAAPGVFARPRYHVQPLSLRRLSDLRLTPLDIALKSWRAAGGLVGADGQPLLKEGRSLLASMGSGPALLTRIGLGYTTVEKQWFDAAVGNRLDALPDAFLGAAVAASYQAVANSGEPLLELVDAKIDSPDADPLRYRYEHLLLPWRNACGSGEVVFVSSKSIVRTVF